MLSHIGKRFFMTGSKGMSNNMFKMIMRAMSSGIQKCYHDYSIKPTEELKQFSKAPIMDNYGELKFGEIPEPLKYVRPFNQITLSKGIRVCTETSSSPLAAVVVFLKQDLEMRLWRQVEWYKCLKDYSLKELGTDWKQSCLRNWKHGRGLWRQN